MAESWYYRIDGAVRGPATFAELKKLADAGQLSATDFVRRESQSTWQRAGEVKNLWLKLATATEPVAARPANAETRPAAPAASIPAPPSNAGDAPAPADEMVDPLSDKLSRAFKPRPSAAKSGREPPPARAASAEAPPPVRTAPAPLAPAAPATDDFLGLGGPAPSRTPAPAAASRKPEMSLTAKLAGLGATLLAMSLVAAICVLWLRDQFRPTPPAAVERPAELPAEQSLEQVAAELNAQAPAVLQPGLRIDAVTSGPGARLTFLCTLTDLDAAQDEFAPAQFTAEVRPGMVAALRNGAQHGFLQRQQIEVQYKFRDKRGRDAVTVTIPPKDL